MTSSNRAHLRAESRRHRRPCNARSPNICRSRPAMFPDGELTDRGREFRIAEMIREKLTLELNQEVPYGIAVEVERLVEEDGQLMVDAAIWVDREGQKPIVIGAKGERLKRVGRSARLALERAARPAAAPDTVGESPRELGGQRSCPAGTRSRMSAQRPPHPARSGLHPAPPALSRHQPHPRSRHPRSRPALAVRARRARTEGETRLYPAAVSDAAVVLDRARARPRSSRAPKARKPRRRCPPSCLMAVVLSERAADEAHHAPRSVAGVVRYYHETLEGLRHGGPLEPRATGVREASARGAGLRPRSGDRRHRQASPSSPTSTIISVRSRGWSPPSPKPRARSPATRSSASRTSTWRARASSKIRGGCCRRRWHNVWKAGRWPPVQSPAPSPAAKRIPDASHRL